MKIDIEKYELIERYLKNELTDDENQKVKQQMQSDSDFAREVKQHESLINFVTEGSLLKMKDSIENIHSNLNKSFFRKIFNNRPLLFTLTGLIVATISVIYFISNKESKGVTENKNIKTKDIVANRRIDVENNTIQESERKQAPLIPYDQEVKAVINQAKDADDKPQQETKNIEKTIPPIKYDIAEDKKTQVRSNSEKKKEQTIQKAVISDIYDCSQVEITAEVTVENSCVLEATGSIEIDHSRIEGGTPPFKVSIDDQKTFQSELRFDQLAAGSYTVWLTDKNKCSEKIGTFWINTTDCSSETNDYVFAPDKQEKWKIPYVESAYQIEIFNQQGILVYKAELGGNIASYWDGYANSGQVQPMGIYSFILKRQEQVDITGNVTIVR
jgi:hypothetical protein